MFKNRELPLVENQIRKALRRSHCTSPLSAKEAGQIYTPEVNWLLLLVPRSLKFFQSGCFPLTMAWAFLVCWSVGAVAANC